MGIAVLQGRDFALTDDEHATPVAIIDETLARREFGTQSPLGRRIATRGVDKLEWRTIVGVVATIKRHGLGETTTQGTYYWALRQSPTRIFRIVVRSQLGVGLLAARLRTAMAQVDPEQPIWDITPMQARLAHSLAPQRTPLLLFALFASVALALSGIGDPASAQAERGIGHGGRLEEFAAQEIAQAALGNALHDLGGEQNPHTLIPHLRAGIEQ